MLLCSHDQELHVCMTVLSLYDSTLIIKISGITIVFDQGHNMDNCVQNLLATLTVLYKGMHNDGQIIKVN